MRSLGVLAKPLEEANHRVDQVVAAANTMLTTANPPPAARFS